MKIERQHLNHRILIKKNWESNPHEVKVLQISPNKEYVKLEYENGNQIWEPIDGYRVVDDLGEPEIYYTENYEQTT